MPTGWQITPVKRASLRIFGDFSTMGFTMIGLGEPRGVEGGVVGGTYFEVMGLRPVLGRLIGPQDDGPNAAGVIVLTYCFCSTVCWIPGDVVFGFLQR